MQHYYAMQHYTNRLCCYATLIGYFAMLRYYATLLCYATTLQYPSNVSYHLLARNETRIARNETRIAGNENCLARNFSFLASALQVPLSVLTVACRNDCRVWRKSLSGHVSYRWFLPWVKHRRCATGVRYFVALSGQFLFYMYWSTWWAFVLPVRLS